MKLNRSHIITAGTILIAGGALTILRQALTTGPTSPPLVGDFSLERWLAGTEFPGLPMICLGALLWGIGAFMRR